MLNFWYSDRCNRQIKLMVCIITCAIIYLCAAVQQLTPLFAGISLGIGFMVHALRSIYLKFSTHSTSQQTIQNLLLIIPVLALMLLILYLPTPDKIYLALQCMGFSAIGFFMLSIFAHRAKRFESERNDRTDQEHDI